MIRPLVLPVFLNLVPRISFPDMGYYLLVERYKIYAVLSAANSYPEICVNERKRLSYNLVRSDWQG
jgi:hypothetical protein